MDGIHRFVTNKCSAHKTKPFKALSLKTPFFTEQTTYGFHSVVFIQEIRWN